MMGFKFTRLTAVVAAALPVGVLMSAADARVGGGGSTGSRGSRTFSAPPPTSTAPSVAPMQRSVTQPTRPGAPNTVGAAPGGRRLLQPAGTARRVRGRLPRRGTVRHAIRPRPVRRARRLGVVLRPDPAD